MAHYAFLDENNIVVEVITGKDENELDDNGNVVDWEKHYGEFRGMTCKRTSYNTHGNVHQLGGTPFRKNYAVIGCAYDPEFDAFMVPKPFDSWKLNYSTFLWDAPVPKPADEQGFIWRWSETNKEWVKIPVPVES